MTDFIDYKNITNQAQFIIQISITLLTVFLTIFYVLLLTLSNSAEDAKTKILIRKYELDENQKKFYDDVGKFVLISAEYFQVMSLFLILQVLKVIANYFVEGTYSIYPSFFYLSYLAWYFSKIVKEKILPIGSFCILFGWFYLLPSIIWIIIFPCPFSLDILLSFALLVFGLSIWFCIYPGRYLPFTNLKKLQNTIN
ncbi:MAG: hypothetical protein KJ808_08385 [Acidobacteria bacterium]|nr:hypothetical protein [Acidobacteriota bacterium]MBU4307342.1 hypothetical protein [Acidobacteriota bacterium]MCG2810499.1 hypothetical protein [Candidatus Aminicenantes bacterium]MCG2821719.1 hypothetical protein [Candidatus Atribacteria bacterium]